MDSDEIAAVVQGKDLSYLYKEEKLEFESVWGEQHIAVLENFAANILEGVPLLAPGSDGINSVELANAIYLSSWLGEDRKSTRMNSSHVAISYYVFCLIIQYYILL